MRLLTFRPRASHARSADSQSLQYLPGAYAGRARYRPRHPSNIPPELQRAIGQLVEFGCAGVAPAGDRFAGQPLFMEWRRDDLFDGYLIPEQDLEFLPAPTACAIQLAALRRSED